MEQLSQALSATLSPDKAMREAAETHLIGLRKTAGQIVVLLQVISAADGVQRELRQAAAIMLKNAIRQHWEPRGDAAKAGDVGIFPADRAVLKENLLAVLVRETDNSVRNLVVEGINEVARCDLIKGEWPTLLPEVMGHLTSGDQLRTYNSLVALRGVVKIFEHKPFEQRAPLDQIVEVSFPQVLAILGQTAASNTIEAAQTNVLILKLLWNATQFALPKCYREDPALTDPWMEACLALLQKPLPEASEGLEPAGQPTDEEERMAWPWWKAKKRAMQLAARWFERFGRKGKVEDMYKPFQARFYAGVAPKLLECTLGTLALRSQGRWCSDRVVHLALQFVNTAAEQSETYKQLKPHLGFILEHAIFRTLCLTPAELELWNDDPHEFVRRGHDIEHEFLSPKTAALTLLDFLCGPRGKKPKKGGKSEGHGFLAEALTFLTGKLTAFQMASPAEKNYQEKEAVLYAVGALCDLLARTKMFKNNVEMMLVQHVLPEFTSPHGFLRHRALWCLKRYCDFDFKDNNNVVLFTRAALDCLRDPDLPVQVEAAGTIAKLLQAQAAAKEVVGTVLGQVLSEYFRLMSEIGSDEVVEGLAYIVEQYPEQMPALADQLSATLVKAWWSYAGEADDDDEMVMAAVGSLDTICTVMQACVKSPHVFPQIEQHVLPVIAKVLDKNGEGMDFLENVLELLAFLTFYSPTISPHVWECYPMLVGAFEEFAYDYVDYMHPVFDNYMRKGTDFFVSGTACPDGRTPVDMVRDMVRRVLQNDDSDGAYDCIKVANLALSCLQHCPGRVDGFVPEIIDICLLKLNGGSHPDGKGPAFPPAKPDKLKVTLVMVVANCLHYNPQLALAVLEARGATEPFLNLAFTLVAGEALESYSASKMFVLGFASLFRLPAASLPPTLQAKYSDLFHFVVRIAAEIHHDETEETPDHDEVEDEAEYEDDDSEEGFDDDEDVDDGSEEYLKFLESQSSKIDGWMNGLDDDDEDRAERESPIDHVNEFSFLAQIVQEAAAREAVFQQLQAHLSAEQRQLLQTLAAYATQKQEQMDKWAAAGDEEDE